MPHDDSLRFVVTVTVWSSVPFQLLSTSNVAFHFPCQSDETSMTVPLKMTSALLSSAVVASGSGHIHAKSTLESKVRQRARMSDRSLNMKHLDRVYRG